MSHRKLTFLLSLAVIVATMALAAPVAARGKPLTTNGWFNGTEIYYLDQGVEQHPEPAHLADIFLIGGDRVYQANVIDTVPGVEGYSPHWDVNIVNTAEGVTLDDILASPFASSDYPVALFDSVEDIWGAEAAGLVTVFEPGVVVLCPVVSEAAADAPGLTAKSEDFAEFPQTF